MAAFGSKLVSTASEKCRVERYKPGSASGRKSSCWNGTSASTGIGCGGGSRVLRSFLACLRGSCGVAGGFGGESTRRRRSKASNGIPPAAEGQHLGRPGAVSHCDDDVTLKLTAPCDNFR